MFNKYDAVANALLTEWKEFCSSDYDKNIKLMKNTTIFGGKISIAKIKKMSIIQ